MAKEKPDDIFARQRADLDQLNAEVGALLGPAVYTMFTMFRAQGFHEDHAFELVKTWWEHFLEFRFGSGDEEEEF